MSRLRSATLRYRFMPGHVSPGPGRARAGSVGLTLIELVLAVALISILAASAVAGYQQVIDNSRNQETIADMRLIELVIAEFHSANAAHPASLVQTSAGAMRDPWNNPYVYTNLFDAPKTPGGIPMVPHRKDKNLNPLNTDYDLYSMGKDGDSQFPLTAHASRDDIVRAADGAFVGIAEDY